MMKANGFVWPATGLLACWMLTSLVPTAARSGDQPQPPAPAADAGQPGRPDAPAPAPTAQPAAPQPIPEDLRDAAFDRYVDLYLLGKAWGGVDPVLLADCGLQLAEGERVLLRPHKALPAERVLALAVKAAADRHDTATLDRLAKAAERDGRNDLASQVASARKLAGAARAVDPTATVAVEEMTPNEYAVYQRWLLDLKAARLAGDGEALGKLEAELPALGGVSQERSEQLKKQLAEARASLPEKANPEAAALIRALDRLRAVSRCEVDPC